MVGTSFNWQTDANGTDFKPRHNGVGLLHFGRIFRLGTNWKGDAWRASRRRSWIGFLQVAEGRHVEALEMETLKTGPEAIRSHTSSAPKIVAPEIQRTF